MHPNSADRILREAFDRAGIEGASTHSFRRTALTQMSNAGIPLRIIQEISGHSNLEQLQKYLEVKPDQVKGAIASLSMLSYAGKEVFPRVQDELPAGRYRESNCHKAYQTRSLKKFPTGDEQF